jgi:hypothetical protein
MTKLLICLKRFASLRSSLGIDHIDADLFPISTNSILLDQRWHIKIGQHAWNQVLWQPKPIHRDCRHHGGMDNHVAFFCRR